MLSQIFGHEFHELELFDETTSTLFQAIERASYLAKLFLSSTYNFVFKCSFFFLSACFDYALSSIFIIINLHAQLLAFFLSF